MFYAVRQGMVCYLQKHFPGRFFNILVICPLWFVLLLCGYWILLLASLTVTLMPLIILYHLKTKMPNILYASFVSINGGFILYWWIALVWAFSNVYKRYRIILLDMVLGVLLLMMVFVYWMYCVCHNLEPLS